MTSGRAGPGRVVLVLLLALLAAAGLVGVALSPLLMGPIGRLRPDWEQLSWVGTAYGGVSAVISALALAGVAASLLVQTRQVRVQRANANRELHMELVRMAMDNPRYNACWGRSATPAPQNLDPDLVSYLNLIIQHWRMGWAVGSLSEIDLRRNAAKLFGGEAGRRYWGPRAASHVQHAVGRRERRFQAILLAEYQRAVAAGPPQVGLPEPEPAPGTRRTVRSAATAVVAAAVLGGALVALGTLRRDRQGGNQLQRVSPSR